jgi:hypothetical protein
MAGNTPDVGFSFGVAGDAELLSTINALRTELAGLRAEQDRLGGSAAGAAKGFGSLANGAQLTTKQLREARGELMLTGEALGVRLPRELRTFLAELPGVGKLLAAAFSVTAIAFLVEKLIELPGHIANISQSLMGWGKSAKEAYASQLELNRKYLKDSEELEEKIRHIPEAGLTGAAKTRAELAHSADDLAQRDREINERRVALDKLTQDYAKIAEFTGEGSIPAILKESFVPSGLENAPKEIKRLNDELNALIKERGELAKVTQPRLKLELGIQSTEEQSQLARSAAESAEKSATSAAKRELEIRKALEDAGEIDDKAAYDRGLITLEQYYDRRALAIQRKGKAELAAIDKERTAVQAQLATITALPAGRTATEQAAHLREIADLTDKISGLNAQETKTQLTTGNELVKTEGERHAATISHRRAELEMQKQLAEAEGNRLKADEASAKLLELKLTEELQQLGLTKSQIEGLLVEFRAAESAKTAGEGAQRSFESGAAGLTARKDQLQEQVAAEQILPYQAARELRAEYEKEIPLLQAQALILREQAAAILAAAAARGEMGPNTVAEGFTKQADEDTAKIAKLQLELAKADSSWMQWKTEAKSAIDQVSTEMTTGLNGWIEGHQRFGQAVAQTWNKVVMTAIGAVEKIAAHWVAQHLKMLLFKQTTNQAGVASDASAAAQGESIRRTSGLKSVLQAAKVAAVNAFKSVWETVPFPLNVVLAPVAAAGAFAGALAIGAFAQGGAVTLSAAPRFIPFSSGGRIRGAGTGSSDSIPILASNGEHVMTAAASRAIGPGVLDAINADPERFSAMLRGASLPSITQPAPYSVEGFRRYASGGAIDASSHGGDVTFNLPTHIGEMNALDGASVRAMLEEHGDLIGSIAVAAVKRHFRTNGVGG